MIVRLWPLGHRRRHVATRTKRRGRADKALGGHPETNILGETFYSQAPIRYGDYLAKVAVAPVFSSEEAQAQLLQMP